MKRGSGHDGFLRQLRALALPAVLALTGLALAPARADEITLLLSTPRLCECGWVSVNGYVSSTGTLRGMVWDWGDGTRTFGWFPAPHRYATDGTYTVAVTAVGCTNRTEVTTVEVEGATGPGCPTEASPSCDSYPCRYVFPRNIHLTGGATTSDPLEIRDSAGTPVGGAKTFTPDDATLVSISPAGFATGLRTEGSSEIGTWIHATIDGRQAANACVARVLPSDYGVTFLESVGERTALFYPSYVQGEDIGSLVQGYEIPAVNEYAHAIDSEWMGAPPFGGCRQIFEVDFGVTEASRVCGISGNPIRLGWNIEGNSWQNCFLVPFISPRSPQWSVYYHELGHNFTWASGTFANALSTFHYSEGVASVMSLAVIDRVLGSPAVFPTGSSARVSLKLIYDQESQRFLQARQTWLNGGAVFSALDPDVVDGIWLYHAGKNVATFAGRFFLPLDPGHTDAMGGALCGVGSDAQKHTFFAALVSAAAGGDLSATFANVYHYPIDAPLFAVAYEAASGAIDATAAGRIPGQGGWPGLPLRANKAIGGQLALAWDPSCVGTDTDYAVYEGTLGAFYTHASRICSTGGATGATLTPSAGSAYYLVVPRNASREGSYGTASSGRERPQGGGSCLPQLTGICR